MKKILFIILSIYIIKTIMRDTKTCKLKNSNNDVIITTRKAKTSKFTTALDNPILDNIDNIIKKNKCLTKISLIEFFDSNLQYYNKILELNNKYKCDARLPGLHEIVSENIVKFVFENKNIKCINGNSGDLIVDNYKVECKCFTSVGPISFGPTEQWDKIIFIDAHNWMNYYFKIYEVDLSNTSDIWKNIKINKNESFEDQCNQKRRPRICWSLLEKQIPNEHKHVLFDGDIHDLLS